MQYRNVVVNVPVRSRLMLSALSEHVVQRKKRGTSQQAEKKLTSVLLVMSFCFVEQDRLAKIIIDEGMQSGLLNGDHTLIGPWLILC